MIPTLGSMVARAYRRLNEDTELMLYQVTSHQIHSNRKHNIQKVEIGLKCLDPSVPTKVLMIVGGTGVGKSTLINAFVNYIFDIKWEDRFRFVLIPESKSQTQSQTQWITAYTFHLVQGSKIAFNLTLIDTPGFSDTQGLEKDQKLMDQIEDLFTTSAPDGIDHVDGIALTVRAHDSRLTHTQRYIFNAMKSIFGNDIVSNFYIMATHADGGPSEVIAALNEASIPTNKTFKFNNSALFIPPSNAEDFVKKRWELGVNNVELFLAEFKKVEIKSLTLLTNEQHLDVLLKRINGVISDLKQMKMLQKPHNATSTVQPCAHSQEVHQWKDTMGENGAKAQGIVYLKSQLKKDFEQAYLCIQNLDRTAQKSSPISQVQFIESQAETRQQPGWDFQQDEGAQNYADIISHIKRQTSMEEFLKERGFNEEDLTDDKDLGLNEKDLSADGSTFSKLVTKAISKVSHVFKLKVNS